MITLFHHHQPSSSSSHPETIDVIAEDIPEDAEAHEPELNTESELLDDKEEDRFLNDDFNLVGRKIKALYANGWFIGSISYFSTSLNEYKVEFADGTSDYIEPADIDNVEVIIMD